MRKADVRRKTEETDVRIQLNLDGTGAYDIRTGVPFLDHMLCLFAKHGAFNLTVEAKGDLEVEAHHTVEDVGIVLGQAFRQALGDKKGIRRYGSAVIPMDESLALAAVDFGGRAYSVIDVPVQRDQIGNFPTELLVDFFEAFAQNVQANVHVKLFYGRNDHHKIEAAFKAFARACRQAVESDPRASNQLPSTKGML